MRYWTEGLLHVLYPPNSFNMHVLLTILFYILFCPKYLGQAIKSFNFFLFQNTEVVVSGDVHLFGYRFRCFLP